MLTLHQTFSPGKSNHAFPSSPKESGEPAYGTQFPPLKKMEHYSLYLIIPMLGVLLPLIGGFNVFAIEGWQASITNNIYFIGMAILIFKGNLYFLWYYRMRKRSSLQAHVQVLSRYYFINLCYTTLIAMAGLSAWNTFIMHRPPFEKPVLATTLLIITATLILNNLFEILLANSEKKYAAERLRISEEQRTVAELKMLNSQMDPHFIFNALSGLCCYIKQDPALAGMYTTKLAEMYAYVLEQKNHMLTPLGEELRFCENYFFLQQLRFGQAVQLKILPLTDGHNNHKVPPLTLQTLVENAIKHNCFSMEHPLIIHIQEGAGNIEVRNNIQSGRTGIVSGGLGLFNLNERVKMINRKPIRIFHNDGEFAVTVPLA